MKISYRKIILLFLCTLYFDYNNDVKTEETVSFLQNIKKNIEINITHFSTINKLKNKLPRYIRRIFYSKNECAKNKLKNVFSRRNSNYKLINITIGAFSSASIQVYYFFHS